MDGQSRESRGLRSCQSRIRQGRGRLGVGSKREGERDFNQDDEGIGSDDSDGEWGSDGASWTEMRADEDDERWIVDGMRTRAESRQK